MIERISILPHRSIVHIASPGCFPLSFFFSVFFSVSPSVSPPFTPTIFYVLGTVLASHLSWTPRKPGTRHTSNGPAQFEPVIFALNSPFSGGCHSEPWFGASPVNDDQQTPQWSRSTRGARESLEPGRPPPRLL
jgi:hypothetical protein